MQVGTECTERYTCLLQRIRSDRLLDLPSRIQIQQRTCHQRDHVQSGFQLELSGSVQTYATQLCLV